MRSRRCDGRDGSLCNEDFEPLKGNPGRILVRPFIESVHQEQESVIVDRLLDKRPETRLIPASQPTAQEETQRAHVLVFASDELTPEREGNPDRKVRPPAFGCSPERRFLGQQVGHEIPKKGTLSRSWAADEEKVRRGDKPT